MAVKRLRLDRARYKLPREVVHMAGRQGELPLDLENIPMLRHLFNQPRVQSHLPAAARGAWADVPAVHCDGAVVGA